MLRPVTESHSINRVIASFIIPRNIIKPDLLFEKAKKSDGFNKYQKKGLSKSKTINVDFDNLNVLHEEINGFLFEMFNDSGNTSNVFRVENITNKAQIVFENRDYVSWEQFQQALYQDLESLTKVFELFVEAITLTYIDEFFWDSIERIQIDQIFDTDSELLNKQFVDSFNGTLMLVSQTDKQVDVDFDEEKTEVSFNNHFKRIVINHTFATKFSDVKSYEHDQNFIKSGFTKAHQANKTLLKRILNKEVQDLIKLK